MVRPLASDIAQQMPSRKGVTTIQLEKKTRDKLMDLGKKEESYGQIISKLVDFWLKRKRQNGI